MVLELLSIIFLFSSFLISCYLKENKKEYLKIGLIIFVIVAVAFRIHIPLNASADYLYYIKSKLFELDFSQPFNDLMISVFYNTINYFFNDKVTTVNIMFYALFIQSLVFYSWIVYTKIPFYKKVILFSITYFLFSYTLLRNAIAYELVFLFFYYLTHGNKNKIWLLIVAVTFHFSSLLILISRIQKNTFKQIFFLLIFFLLIITLIFEVVDIEIFISKITSYYNYSYNFNLNHYLWILFITALFLLALKENVKQVIATRIYIIYILFLTTYLINPIPAFRFSIYVLCIYSTVKVNQDKNFNLIKNINFLSILLVVFFIISFFKTFNTSILNSLRV